MRDTTALACICALQLAISVTPTRAQSAPCYYASYLGSITHQPGEVVDVAAQGTITYLAIDNWGLAIYDTADYQEPALLGVFEIENPHRVRVRGSIVYLTAGCDGLKVIDVSDPAFPLEIGSTGDAGCAGAIEIVGTTAFVTGFGASMAVIDISDPTSPEVLSTVGDRPNTIDVAVRGSLAVVTDQSGVNEGVYIYDVSDLSAPFLLGHIQINAVGEVSIVGDSVLVTTRFRDLVVVDISDPANPRWMTSYDTPGEPLGVDVQGSLALVGVANRRPSEPGWLIALDISVPHLPTLVFPFHISDNATRVVVEDQRAYVLNGNFGVHVIDVSGWSDPTCLGDFETAGVPRAVSVADQIACVALMENGMQIVDVSDPDSPEHLATYQADGVVHDVKVVGTTAFLAAGVGVMEIVDISSPRSPVLIGSHRGNQPSHAWRIDVDDGIAYLTDHVFRGLWMFDVSNPQAPAYLGSIATPGAVPEFAVDGGTAYLIVKDTGLLIVDVSDPTAPALRGTFPMPGGANDVAVIGTTAVVVTPLADLVLIDVADATLPVIIGQFADILEPGGYGPNDICRVAVTEAYAYVTHDYDGFYVVDVSDPSAPVVAGRYGGEGVLSGLTVEDGVAYIVDDDGAFQMFDASTDCSLGCPPDLTTSAAALGEPGYGLPDGIITGADLMYFVNGWVAGDLSIADVTSQNAPVGHPSHGQPDGLITGTDIQFYVNLWIAGCP